MIMEKTKMLRQIISIILCFSFLVSYFPLGTLTYAANYESYHGFSTSEEPVLPENEVHPSLWFNSSELEDLKEKRSSDVFSLQLWNQIKNSEFLGKDLPSVPNVTQTSVVRRYYGEMARIAKYNAFMYLMEENELYKTTAIEALKRAFDGPIYELDPTISSSPVDEIYRAAWAQNFAAAYDWIQPYLTVEEDSIIRQNLIREAEETYEKLYIWGPRPHNHLSKPAWGMGTIALVLSDHPDAAKWLQRTLEAANSNTKYFFSEDGVYREGPHYYVFSLVNLVPFLYHYKNVSKVDFFPIYKPAFEWALKIRNGKGWLPAIEDSWIKPAPLHMVAKEYMESDTDLHQSAKLGNLFQWSFFNTDLNPWQPDFSYNGASLDDTWDLDQFLTYDPTIEQIKPEESGTLFLEKGGQTVFRNNWNYNDPSTRYLLFHGVAEADNHDHQDHLSFVIHAQNQMMASDSGYSRSSYGDPERITWYATPKAHNVITVNNNKPQDFAENKTPVSRYSMDTDFFDFEEKEATYLSGGKQTRAIGFPGQDYFVVVDEVNQPELSQYDLYLHGGLGSISGNGSQRVWTYKDDSYGNGAKFATWVFPSQDTIYSNQKGEVTYVKDHFLQTDYLQATRMAKDTQFMQILIPLGMNEEIPSVQELSSGNVVGANVQKDGFQDLFAQQTNQENMNVKDFSTDGTFMYTRSKDGLKHLSFRQGTYLKDNGSLLVSSTKAITLALNVEDEASYVGTIADNNEEYELRVKNPIGRSTNNVIYNGDIVEFQVENGYTILTLQGGGELEVLFDEGSIPNAPVIIGEGKDSHVQLRWNQLAQAMEYGVYRKASDEQDYVHIDTTKTPSYVDYGVTNGINYSYKVKAVNAFGGTFSDNIEAKPVPATSTPSIPQALEIQGSNNKATLSWEISDNAYAYEIYRSMNYGEFEKKAEVRGNQYIDTILEKGSTYSYKIKAINSKGNSEFSEEVQFIPRIENISAPKELKSTSGDKAVILTWDRVEGATSYNVKRSLNGINYELVASVDLPFFVDVSIENNTKYYYQVSAENAYTEGPASFAVMAEGDPEGGELEYFISQLDEFYIEAEYSTKMKNTKLVLDEDSSNLQGIKGNPNLDAIYHLNSLSEEEYKVFIRVKNTEDIDGELEVYWNNELVETLLAQEEWAWYDVEEKLQIGKGKNTLEIKSNNNSLLVDRILFANTDNSTPKDKDSLLPSIGIGRPRNVEAKAVKDKVVISWEAMEGVTGYNIKRSRISGENYTVIAKNVQGTSFEDLQVYTGTQYYYVISGNTPLGETADSLEVGAKPQLDVFTFSPSDNSYIEKKSPDTSFFTNAAINVKTSDDAIRSSENDRIGYMKFNISDFQEELGSAILQVSVRATSNDDKTNELDFNMKVYGMEDDSWNQRDLTWNNSPNHESGRAAIVGEDTGEVVLLGEIPVSAAEKTVQIDVTDYIKNHNHNEDKLASFMFIDTEKTGIFAPIRSTRDSRAERRPVLILTPKSDVVDIPNTPKHVRLTSGDGINTITWEGVDNVQGYNVKRSLDGINYNIIARLDSQKLEYNDTNVVNQIPYYYIVTSVKDGIESDPSWYVWGVPKSSLQDKVGVYNLSEESPYYFEVEIYTNSNDSLGLITAVEDISLSNEQGLLFTSQMGDVNSDGKVDSGDALVALKIALGSIKPTNHQRIVADVNQDGKVNALDSLLIVQNTLGLRQDLTEDYYVEYEIDSSNEETYNIWVLGQGEGKIKLVLNEGTSFEQSQVLSLGVVTEFNKVESLNFKKGTNLIRLYPQSGEVKLDKFLLIEDDNFNPNENGGFEAEALRPFEHSVPKDLENVTQSWENGKLIIRWNPLGEEISGVLVYNNSVLIDTLRYDSNSYEVDWIGMYDYYSFTFKTVNTLGIKSNGITVEKENSGSSTPVRIEVESVSASSDDGNVAQNVLDEDLSTRWSAQGDGEWIEFDLGSTKEVGYLGLAFHSGDKRSSKFSVDVSNDKSKWERVLDQVVSSGTTLEMEAYPLQMPVEVRYIRIVGHGNSVNAWNSITEAHIYEVNESGPILIPVGFGPITVTSVDASSNDGNLPQNTIDGDLSTRWSAQGDGEWIEFDLGSTKEVGYLGLAFHSGDKRSSKFSVEISNDKSKWERVLDQVVSSGTTLEMEAYPLQMPVEGRYIRIVGHGNSVNAWNSITEAHIYEVNDLGIILAKPRTKVQPEVPVQIVYTKPGLYEANGAVHKIHTPNPVTGRTLNVLDFGARPNEEDFDNGPAIQAAINAANPGDEVFIPNGIYHLINPSQQDSRTNLILKSKVNLRGESQDGVQLISHFDTELNTRVFRILGENNIVISDITISSTFDREYCDDHRINNPYAGGPVNGIFIEDRAVPGKQEPSYNITIDRVTVEKFQRMGVRISKSHDIVVRNSTFQNATDVGGGGAGYGVTIQGEGNKKDRLGYANDTRFNVVENSRFIGPYIRHGALIQYYAHNNVVRDNYFENSQLDAIDLHGEDEYLNEIYNNTIKDIITGAGIGIGNTGATHEAAGPMNYIHSNIIENSREGIKVHLGSPDTIIENNTIINSTVGNGKGIYLQNAPGTIVRNNKIYNNQASGFWGIYLEEDRGDSGYNGRGAGIPKDIIIEGNEVYGNTNGIRVQAGENIWIYSDNVFEGNLELDTLYEVEVKLINSNEPGEPQDPSDPQDPDKPGDKEELELVLVATDDAEVNSVSANRDINYGSNDLLKPKVSTSGGTIRPAFIKFNKSELNEPVTKAILQLYATFGTGATEARYSIYGISNNNWDEDTVTWNKAPNQPKKGDPEMIVENAEFLGEILFAREEVNNDPVQYKLDITEYIQNHIEDEVTIMIVDLLKQDANVNIRSREHESLDNHPMLIVTYLGAGENADSEEPDNPEVPTDPVDPEPPKDLEELILVATDDAEVKALADSDTNFGKETLLKPKSNPKLDTLRIAFFKFNKSELNNPVIEAILQLYATFGSGDVTEAEYSIYGVINNDWTENTVTWNTAPNMPKIVDNEIVIEDAIYLGKIRFVKEESNSTVEYLLDITEYVQNQLGSEITIMIVDELKQNANINIRSKEHNSTNQHPKLQIMY